MTLNDSEPVCPVVADWLAGWVVTLGAALTVRVAALLMADKLLASVTMARYSREPADVKPLTVKVVLVAPATPLPLLRLVNETPLFVEICHCTVSGVLPPPSAMVKDADAVWPTVAVAFCGCVVIEGAPLTVSVAAVLVVVTALASVTTTWYSVPDAGRELLLMVSMPVVAPLIPEPLLRLLKLFPPLVDTCH